MVLSLVVFLQHFIYAREPVAREVDLLKGAGSPGEVVSLSFSISDQKDRDAIDLTCGPLISPLGALDSNCVDLHVVKIWEQSGIGLYQSDSISVAELLLKDDRVELKDGYRRTFKRLRHIVEPFWLYQAPEVRLSGPVLTSLTSGQSKQIIVSIRIPLDAKPGQYDGELIIKANGDVHRLNVNLEIYPIKLAESRQDTMIWYKGSLDWRDGQHHVSEQMFRRQLEDIYNTGFRSISINETDTTLTQKAINIAEEIGFNRHLLIFWPRSNKLDELRFRKTTPVYFVDDELDLQIKRRNDLPLHEHPQVKSYIMTANAVKNHAGKTLSTIHSEPNARALSRELALAATDVQGYYLPKNTEYFFFRSQFEQMRMSQNYYYWPAHMEKPDLHRVLAGVYLWKSGADGIQPYCYQHLPKFPYSAYDDFDEWEPDSDLEDTPRRFRDHLSTYPSKHGPIPTLQWLGMRDGLTDLKYLNTLDQVLNQAESIAVEDCGIAGQIRRDMEKFLDKIDLRSISIDSEFDPQPYGTIQSQEYHEFREFCARAIIQLQKIIASWALQDNCLLSTGI